MAIRSIRPEFAHLDHHPFVHDGESSTLTQAVKNGSITPEEPGQTSRASANAFPSSGPSKQNKFHFWYIGESLAEQ